MRSFYLVKSLVLMSLFVISIKQAFAAGMVQLNFANEERGDLLAKELSFSEPHARFSKCASQAAVDQVLSKIEKWQNYQFSNT